MTVQHEKEQVMTTRPVRAVSYYVEDDTWLPGMTVPHVLRGWYAYWRCYAPNGQQMSAVTSGPYDSREDALKSLYSTPDEITRNKMRAKVEWKRNNKG